MAEPTRRSPFADLAARMAGASWPGATLEPVPFLAQVGLRVANGGRAAVQAVLGGPLPETTRVATTRFGDLLGLGPDEWLVVGPDGTEAALESALQAAIGPNGAVVGLSGNGAAVLLRGEKAGAVLSTCCSLDLHPSVFTPGRCAGTLLAKASIVIQQLDVAPTYRLLMRPSFAEYVVGWLIEGMRSIRAEI